jgi:hypothetical protein
MTSADLDGQAAAPDDRYRPLLAVSEAIVSHRDLSASFATPGLALSAGCAACRRQPSSTDWRGSWV